VLSSSDFDPLADLKRYPAGGPQPFRAALRDRGSRAAPAYPGSKARYAMQSYRRAGQRVPKCWAISERTHASLCRRKRSFLWLISTRR